MSKTPKIINQSIELVPIQLLKQHPENVNQGDVGVICESIEANGFYGVVVAQKSTGHILKGNHTVKGAEAQGMFEVPVAWVDCDDERALRIMLADNRTARLGRDDENALAELLAELSNSEAGLIGTGYDDSDLQQLIDDLAGNEPRELSGDVDDVPDVADVPTRCKAGELWRLGRHRLLCGDSTKADDVARLMGGEKATLIFTDPPYGVAIGAKNRLLNSFQPSGRNLTDIEDDSLAPEDLKAALLPAFKNARLQMDDDCSIMITVPQRGELFSVMMEMAKDAGLPIRHVLIWVKSQPTFSMGRLDYDYQHEPILFTWGKKHKNRGEGEHKTSIWQIDKPRASKEHPTMKPVELVENAIKNHTDASDIVLDIYCGSGTTLIAAESTGRRCNGIEISPKYCDVIIARFEKLTGETATRID